MNRFENKSKMSGKHKIMISQTTLDKSTILLEFSGKFEFDKIREFPEENVLSGHGA